MRELTAQQKQEIVDRARSCCEYCFSQAKFSPDLLSIEHIVPRSKGGQTQLDNLALACQGCNNHKYNHTEAYDPVTGNLAQLYHPRQQQWNAHFTWSSDFTQIIGLTPTGRATVEKLQLNREGIVNLRLVLRLANQHPPEINS